MALVCVARAELVADVLSELLSVLVNEFALTVTEHAIREPEVATDKFHELLELALVTASDV